VRLDFAFAVHQDHRENLVGPVDFLEHEVDVFTDVLSADQELHGFGEQFDLLPLPLVELLDEQVGVKNGTTADQQGDQYNHHLVLRFIGVYVHETHFGAYFE
jgi:hypothetical protein